MSELHYIAEQLIPLKLAITELNADPNNARTHSEANIKAIEFSLRDHGQRFPIVVQKTGMVVRAGNARLEAAKRLGWTHIAALVIDESNEEALKFALRDNKTAELADWNYEVLSLQLKDFSNTGFDVSELGFDAGDLEVLLKGTFNPGTADNSSGDDVQNHKKHFVTLTDGQFEIVQQAIALTRGESGAEELTDGRCLELICGDFLAGH